MPAEPLLPGTPPDEVAPVAAAGGSLEERWNAVLERVRDGKGSVAAFLKVATPIATAEDRITLAFGKEALGDGDLFIMAAMGAVAGFWGFVIALFFGADELLRGWAIPCATDIAFSYLSVAGDVIFDGQFFFAQQNTLLKSLQN